MLSRLFFLFAMAGVVVAVFPWFLDAWFVRGEVLWGPRPGDTNLLMGILGGSLFGKWIAAALIARIEELWADRALWAGLLVWAGLEGGVSLWMGAWFHLGMTLLPVVVGVGGLLWWKRGFVYGRVGRWNLLAAVCALNLLGGIATAGLINTPVFEVWTANVGSSEAWLAFLFASIGGTIAGHFAMLVFAARRGHWGICLVSVLAWFLLDSTITVLEGAWFNLWMVNLPCLVLVSVATVATARSLR